MAKSDVVMLENCYEIYMMNFNGPMRTAYSMGPSGIPTVWYAFGAQVCQLINSNVGILHTSGGFR